MKVLLVGTTEKGTLALLIEDATWTTVASVADGIQEASTLPITWTAQKVAPRVVGVNDALVAMGLGDRPLADLAAVGF